jgi:hypothetical protein
MCGKINILNPKWYTYLPLYFRSFNREFSTVVALVTGPRDEQHEVGLPAGASNISLKLSKPKFGPSHPSN